MELWKKTPRKILLVTQWESWRGQNPDRIAWLAILLLFTAFMVWFGAQTAIWSQTDEDPAQHVWPTVSQEVNSNLGS